MYKSRVQSSVLGGSIYTGKSSMVFSREPGCNYLVSVDRDSKLSSETVQHLEVGEVRRKQ